LSAPGASSAEAVGLLRGVAEADGHGSPEPLPVAEREPAPWESSMDAVCECLAWRGALENLERRNAEDELGQSAYSEAPVHARPALATAHVLLERGVIGEDELRAKMDEVRQRFGS
jgi:hypothetical protein